MRTAKKQEVKQEVKLAEAFVLWKKKAKSGLDYFTGMDLNKERLVAFYNSTKKNPKEPDVRIYTVNDEGKQDKEVASLWENVSETTGKRYLTGSTDEKEKLVAFYGKEDEEKKPYIRAYFKED